MNDTNVPNWAPRVPRKLILQFYRAAGRGLIDEDIINELGFALLVRCQSILEATEARRGRAACPGCRTIVPHTKKRDEILSCGQCGWQCLWADYVKSAQGRHLNAGGAEPFFEEFVAQFSGRKTARQRLILIDTLIHRWHWEWKDKPCGAAAANLIEGQPKTTIEFLDQITYGDQIPDAIKSMKNTWQGNWERSRRAWDVEYRKKWISTPNRPLRSDPQ
jgi:hypothetical protein